MHIVVALRLTPDLTGDIELTSDGTDIDREWIDLKLNEFDDHALEEALLLRDSVGGRLTALAMDQEGVDRQLQMAIARGADDALKISADGVPNPSPRAAAASIAAAVRDLRPDLFVTGVQTPDDVTGQLAPLVGVHLGWPCVCAVSEMVSSAPGITVRQEHGGGYTERLGVKLPAVIAVQSASQPIRYVSGSKLREAVAHKIPMTTVNANNSTETVTRVSISIPHRSGGAEMLGKDAEAVADRLLNILTERNLLKG